MLRVCYDRYQALMIISYILALVVVSWTFVEVDMLINFPFSSSCIDMTTSEYFLRIFLFRFRDVLDLP